MELMEGLQDQLGTGGGLLKWDGGSVPTLWESLETRGATMKAIAFLRKRDDLTFQQFSDHLLGKHVEFMRALPGLRRWSANLAVHGDDPAPYDAVTEFWFDDAEAFQVAMSSAEVAAALKDGEEFVAAPGPTLMVAREHNVIG
jgi:uncharacterized protein (TIGR02118 family)